MAWFRKALILSHRYLGIVLSVMFVMWFVTGIGMIYSRGMPRLTPQVRLSRLFPLDLAEVKLSPSEAAARAGLDEPAGQVTLLSVLGRPAYRFGRSLTVFADNGETMSEIDKAAAIKVAANFINVPVENVRVAEELDKPDQWTMTLTRQLPLYKIAVDDSSGTHLYVSPEIAEVVQVTTRGSRALAWVSTIPHFLYFKSLRMATGLWQNVMVWASVLACVLAALGVVLGFVQLRRSRPHIRYSGWMKWHHITGLVFGVLTFTWAFSGLVSMEPWGWTLRDDVQKEIEGAFNAAKLDLDRFHPFDGRAWLTMMAGANLKEIEFTNILDEPYYIARTSPQEQSVVGWPDGGHQPYFISRDPDNTRRIIAAPSLHEKEAPFATDVLVNRLKQATPHTAIVASAFLTEYDTYYYSRDAQAPLPVVRVELDDPDKTWVYIDARVGQVVGQANRFNRIERWLYNGLHTLDFSFLYYNRPVWDAAVILLSIGGTALSAIGLLMGVKRLRRAVPLVRH
jgi:uncharacterized iron-regulated membrane protein